MDSDSETMVMGEEETGGSWRWVVWDTTSPFFTRWVVETGLPFRTIRPDSMASF